MQNLHDKVQEQQVKHDSFVLFALLR